MSAVSDLVDPAARIVEATWSLVLDDPSRDPPVRLIAATAGMNQSMVSYYFRGKDGLLGVMFHAHAKPLQQERVRRLSMLKGEDLTLEGVLAAWFAPELDDEAANRLTAICQILALHHSGLHRRLYSEAFDEGTRYFVDVLWGLLPRLSRETVICRLYAMATAVAAAYDPFTLTSLNALNLGERPIDRGRWLAEMISFAAGGFRADARGG